MGRSRELSDLANDGEDILVERVGETTLSQDMDEYALRELNSHIHDLLEAERQLQTNERLERRMDHDIFNGKQVRRDEMSMLYPQYSDLRTTHMRKPVEYLCSFLTSRQVEGRVSPALGAFDQRDMSAIVSEYDLRLKALQDSADVKDCYAMAIRDACITGEGFVWEGIDLIPSRYLAGQQDCLQFFAKYVDWRNIWLDSKSIMPDLSDAHHLFHIRAMNLNAAMRRWPKYRRMLDEIGWDRSLPELPAGAQGYGTTINNWGAAISASFDNLAYQDDERMSMRGNKQILHGVGWIRQWDQETLGPKLWRVEFVMPQSMNRVVVLAPPRPPYTHNRIPYSRVYFELDGSTKRPFSPLVRNTRGLEKMATTMLRTVARQAMSRGIQVDVDAMYMSPTEITKSKSIDQIIREYREEATKTAPVLLAYGGKDAIQLHDLSRDFDKAVNMLTFVVQTIENSSGISPEIMGGSSPQMSGVAMEIKREEARGIFSGIVRALDQAVKGTGERTLSYIEQFLGRIAYPAVRDAKQRFMQLGADGDATIKGNKVSFTISSKEGYETIRREQAAALITALQKADPETAIAMLPAVAGLLDFPGADDLRRQLIEVAQARGIPVPMSSLNEEERKVAEQQIQERAAQARVAREIEQNKIVAETHKIAAETDDVSVDVAQKLLALAQQLQGNTPEQKDQKALEDRASGAEEQVAQGKDTIAGMSREVEALHRQSGGLFADNKPDPRNTPGAGGARKKPPKNDTPGMG